LHLLTRRSPRADALPRLLAQLLEAELKGHTGSPSVARAANQTDRSRGRGPSCSWE
jgi:hypothetical protein